MAPAGLRSVLPLLLLTIGSPLSANDSHFPAVQEAPDVQEAPSDSIRWEGLEEALAASRRDGRPVLAYFTFDT